MGTTPFKIRQVVYKSISIMEKVIFKCNLKKPAKVNSIRLNIYLLLIVFIIIKYHRRNVSILQETLQSLVEQKTFTKKKFINFLQPQRCIPFLVTDDI